MATANANTIRRSPLPGLILSLLILCAFTALYAAYHFWIWDNGSVWEYDKERDYFLISMLGVYLLSWKNASDILVMILSIVAASMIVAKMRKPFFQNAKGKPIMWFYILLTLGSIAGLIIINVACAQRSESRLSTQEYAFWYSVIFELFIILNIQWLTALKKTCPHCGCFALEYKSSSSYEYESTYTYGGKYETRTADIYDENHQKIGEIETRGYEPVQSYSTTNTATHTTYHCRNCGKDITG